jgi:hypothetical protein
MAAFSIQWIGTMRRAISARAKLGHHGAI